MSPGSAVQPQERERRGSGRPTLHLQLKAAVAEDKELPPLVCEGAHEGGATEVDVQEVQRKVRAE